jgi:hypothetical protein
MSNPTVRASATALPVTPVAEISTTGISSRRFFLAAGSAAAIFAGLKGVAHAAASGDADIIALSDDVQRLAAVADDIRQTRVEPFEDARFSNTFTRSTVHGFRKTRRREDISLSRN